MRLLGVALASPAANGASEFLTTPSEPFAEQGEATMRKRRARNQEKLKAGKFGGGGELSGGDNIQVSGGSKNN